MTRPDLKAALTIVERDALAPIARIHAAQPKNMLGHDYPQWARRRRELEQLIAATLRGRGATVSEGGDALRFRFAGVASSSTQGLGMALKNWKTAAEKRLKGRAE